MKSLTDAIGQVGLGIVAAVPLGFGAFLWQQAGWRPFCGYMMIVGSAFLVGRVTAQDKWMRDLDARLDAMQKEIEDDDDDE